MNPTALAYAATVLQAIPALLAAGVSIVGLVEQTNNSLSSMQAENRDPTPAEWDAMNAAISEARVQLHG